MSSSEHPDRDSLSAYLDESLSIDATQWIEQHLGGCTKCRVKLEQEKRFLAELDRLRSVKPPADFTEGVMARVAQYAAYQPRKEVPWKRVAMWGGSAAAAILLVALFIGWVVVSGSSGEGLQVPAGASAFTGAIEFTVWLWDQAAAVAEVARPQAEAAFGLLLFLYEFILDAGLMVQLALLLVTVGLNYALTRMVLNYQRRQ